jgi:uncharacterized protein
VGPTEEGRTVSEEPQAWTTPPEPTPGQPGPEADPASAVVPGTPTKDERLWGMLAHLLALAGLLVGGLTFVGPLIVWLVKKDESEYVAWHGREALNFHLTLLIVAVVLIPVSLFTCGLGALLYLPLVLAAIVLTLVGGIKANDGQRWPYPVSLRLVK